MERCEGVIVVMTRVKAWARTVEDWWSVTMALVGSKASFEFKAGGQWVPS